MVINAWMRPGNTSSLSNCINFLKETLDIVAEKKVGLVRADSGFYSNVVLQHLESMNLSYIIAVTFYETITWEIRTMTQWIGVCAGIAVAEAEYKGRRYVIVRKDIEERPKATGKKLLFEDRIPRYRYSCYVTNLDLSAEEIWKLYQTRADCENRIKELKYDFGADQFCLKSFWATEAAFRFIMIAYNIMSLFRHIAGQKNTLATMRTAKAYCFALGAWIRIHARRRVLKISLPVQKRAWMDGLFAKITDSSPPYSFSNA